MEKKKTLSNRKKWRRKSINWSKNSSLNESQEIEIWVVSNKKKNAQIYIRR